tara:strand:+ start:358 stop:1440 length:1083 start_codon:yes stop_codon:yes gene_type:complete
MFVADLHNDVLQRAIVGEDISIETKEGHSDLERLKKSCIDLEVFVIWIPQIQHNNNPFDRAIKLYEKLLELEQKNNIKIVKNLKEIQNSKRNKILSTPFSIEGGNIIENKIENLHYFINKGLFYFGPTWNNSLEWVSSNYDEKHNRKNIKSFGLNKFGVEVINTCNENGIIVDVSHIGEKSFWDIKKISNKPFIASHSSVHKLCPHHRNLKDNQILAIKESEGLIGLNPYPFFIDPQFKSIEIKFRKKIEHKLQEISLREKDKNIIWIKKQNILQKELKEIAPSIDIFINHIEYIIKLAGIDFVAIGSDYDGLDCLPKELNDCMDHIKIAEKLDERGYSQNDIEKIMGLNVLRVVELIKN